MDIRKPESAETSRKTILHMDMDMFFAAVEILDDPELKGKPLIIGALPTERGVVSTCSYEARKFGVHSGQSIKEAYRLCPDGIYMHGHYHRYQEISDMVHEILESYTDQIEYVSLDEGYLDITASLNLFGSAETIGREIKKRVFETTGLTCSVGIGYNKMTAKLASEEKKPDGFFVIPDEAFFMEYFKLRPVRLLPGVGGKGAAFLHEYHIDTVQDLLTWSLPSLTSLLGETGKHLYNAARGKGSDHVMYLGEGERKSYGKEVTYQQDMTDLPEMISTLKLLARDVSLGLQKRDLYAGSVTLKIKYNDLKLTTRSQMLDVPTRQAQDLALVAAALLSSKPLIKPVRLLGIQTSGFVKDPMMQMSLKEGMRQEKKEQLSRSLMDLYKKFGRNIVETAGEMESRQILESHHLDDS